MTDTGQIPAEGLPENAGMVEQPGVPAHGAYTYLSETTAEDEDLLLLPGAQGAWGNEVPPPAPEPVFEAVHEPAPQEPAAYEPGLHETAAQEPGVYAPAPQEQVPHEAVAYEPPLPEPTAHEAAGYEAAAPQEPVLQEAAPPEAVVHEPGPHETAGRDSGSVDLGGVRLPAPPPPAPVPPRRPLHLGPPLPDTSASPVRSLADRGPAGAPVRQMGPPATGPEYFDAPQLRDLPPQGAAPWGAQAPVSAGVPTAETVVPVGKPDGELVAEPVGGGIAMALDAGVVVPEPEPEPASFMGAVASTGKDADLAKAPDAGGAWQGHGQSFDGEPAAAFAHVNTHVSTEGSGNAGVAEAGQLPEGAGAFEAVPVPVAAPEAAFVVAAEQEPEQVAVAVPVPGADVAPEPEVVPEPEAVPEPEVAQVPEEAVASEGAVLPEAVEVPGAEEVFDAGFAVANEQVAQPVVEAPEEVLAQDAAPEAVAVPEPVQAEDVVYAPAPEQLLEAPNAPEVTPVDEPAVIQEAEPTPAAFTAVETPVTPEAEAEVTPAPEPVVAEAHVTETAQPEPEPQPELQHQPQPHPDDSLGRFVPVEGSVPTTPHLAPTPPHPLVLPAEEQPGVVAESFAAVPAPREADPELVQHVDDLDTRAADQEEESTAVVEDVRESTGPAAPAYDDAEREAVLKVMRERRDIRNGFRSDPIPHDVLLRVLEAAHTAPSVGHSQPWDFVVIRSADTRRNMHELAQSQREAYAKSLPKGRAKQFKELKIEAILDTPVNIVVTADPTRGGRHTLGRHTQPQMAPYSAALAVENLWLAARAEGLGVGWVSFFDEREMVRALGLPEHLEVIAYLCVGYVDEFPDEPELMQAGWSKRRPLSWVVHEETYGRRALPGEDPHDLLAETVAGIRPLDAKALGEAWERQKRMTKPPGSLGMLEIISAQLSGLSRQCPPPIPEPAAVAIFAGDHGVHAQGVTPWPQEVTAQMVANFLGGGAVCNAFASQVGAEVCVVDVGVASELPATPGLLPRKIRAGTSDMTTGPAMSREEAKQAIEVGIETARDLVAAGNKALLTGEMGIANTTASAALISVFTDTDPAEVTGRGTGINDETLARKTEVVRRAIDLHQPDPADPIGVLAAVGGFEHAAMVGLLLGGASLRTPVILDGVSAGAAALVARAIAPEVLAACIAGHRSAEPGHVAALNKLGLRPLVDLDLRLGEGTGALLALPLVQSTARAMHEVATFDSAGVTEK